jgi:mRNA interferase RelE/StbE
MTCKLVFKVDAKKEWDKLDSTIRAQFKKKLVQRLVDPIVRSDQLKGLDNCFKIKLRSVGYCLVYQVRDKKLVVAEIAVGKRERKQVYKQAGKRL